MFVVKLDKERHAKVTRKAFVLFKTKTGKDLEKPEEGQDIGLEDLETLLWASLVKEDPSLTLEQVQDEVEFYQLKQFSKYLQEGSLNPT